MDIDYEKTFGFKPEDIGHRYRHHWIVAEPDSDEQQQGVLAGYLCVKARDGGYNPIDPEACRRPNFVASEEDPPDGMRFYYYRPLTDADREDTAATIAALRKRVEELEGALDWVEPAMHALTSYEKDYGEPLPEDRQIGKIDDSRNSASFRLYVGHIRRMHAALRAKGGGNGV